MAYEIKKDNTEQILLLAVEATWTFNIVCENANYTISNGCI